MQAIARMQARTGKVDDTTHEYLREIALRETRPSGAVAAATCWALMATLGSGR